MSQKTKNIIDVQPKSAETTSIERFMTAKRTAGTLVDKKTSKIIRKQSRKTVELKKIQRVHKFSLKNILIAFLAVIFVGALSASGYFYYQYREAVSADASKDEIADYVAKISKFMALPPEETPTMATVADRDKLSGQSFFANAQNGDKVLFYTKAQKAILYRPATNMIIEASSMSADANIPSVQEAEKVADTDSQAPAEASAEASTEPQATEPSASGEQNQSTKIAETPKMVQVAVYNGTNQKGLAKNISEKISSLPGVSIASTSNAKGVYTKTSVIDVSGNNTEATQKIAEALGAEVGSLPEGEIKSENVDILVFGGSDF